MTDFLAALVLDKDPTMPVLVAPSVTKIALKINAPAVAAALTTSVNIVAALAPIYTTVAVPSTVVNMAIVSVVLERGATGPIGPHGPPGLSMNFAQTIPSALWQINHNFGVYPSVTIIDDDGEASEGDVTYTDLNNLTISFGEPLSGTAYLV